MREEVKNDQANSLSNYTYDSQDFEGYIQDDEFNHISLEINNDVLDDKLHPNKRDPRADL